MKKRCHWTKDNKLMNAYHDTEWGVPRHNDKILFEYIILDAFQAGLSWQIILDKRENFRKAFAEFDAEKIARFTPKKIDSLMNDVGIIRNRLKIEGAVKNAIAFKKVQKEFGSFDKYIWQFVNYKTIVNKCEKLSHMRANSEESDEMAKDMKRRGFAFTGTIVCYAFMQGAGMINDHLILCFRYDEINKLIKEDGRQK